MTKILIIGGGYAGLAALIELRRQLPLAHIWLFDPAPAHLKITQLHCTFRRPLADLHIPFNELASKYNFTHIPATVEFTSTDLIRWHTDSVLNLENQAYPFDALILATGSRPRPLAKNQNTYCLNDFTQKDISPILQAFIQATRGNERRIHVIGGGANGLEFTFALNEILQEQQVNYKLCLIGMQEQLLPSLPTNFHHYTLQQLHAANIDYLPHTRYEGYVGTQLQLTSLADNHTFLLPSDFALLCTGHVSNPYRLETNHYGQVRIDKAILRNIYAAGDCAAFPTGLNTLTAQAAVRKGKQVAYNIAAMQRGQWMTAYRYQERGYFIRLGALDSIGWLGVPDNCIKGVPAFLIKQILETQYEIFLNGLDTYW